MSKTGQLLLIWLWRPFWRLLGRNIPSLVAGVILTLLYVNITAAPATTVLLKGEAEGPQYRDPDTIDLVSTVIRRRDCPAQSQRWAWRYEDDNGVAVPPDKYDGTQTQHFIPLSGTVAPFLSNAPKVMITVSARDVPERLQKQSYWQYRVVTEERCSWLPHVVSRWFGPRLTRSVDQPLNFVGDPH